VQNPPSDYSFGHYLWDRQPRTWEVTGGDLQYAFIIQGDTILNHEGDGSLNVTDSRLNPVPDYHINVLQFKKAMMHLNRFYKR
jgi:membrane-anchored protein YejM (alkaline phosphatase superfamily)